MAGISSPSARAYGLPQFSDSRRANSSARASIASASFSSIRERSIGVVSLQLSNARCAADTALCTWSTEASGTADQQLAGGRVQHLLGFALAADEGAVDQQFGGQVDVGHGVLLAGCFQRCTGSSARVRV